MDTFVEGFRKACLKYYQPGSNISIDEFLIKYKGRSRHTMNIACKAGSRGFKIYAGACEDYIWDILFSSKVCAYQSPSAINYTK